MASTYSTSLRFELPGDGDRAGTWGQMMDTFMGTLLEQAIVGVTAISMTDANYTMTAASGSTDESRSYILSVTSSASLTATRNIIAPAQKKTYIIFNNTTGSQSIQIIGTTGTGITIPNGKKRAVYFDGTNFVDAISDLPSGSSLAGSAIATQTGVETLTNKTLTAPTITSAVLSTIDGSFGIIGSADSSKIVRFEVDGLTTATTRTITVPDVSASMVLTTGAQTLSSKTLDNTTTATIKDTLFTLQDDGDATKLMAFQLSGITTGNTRTVTVADGNFTIGGTVLNAQVGTIYTVLATDRAKLVTFSNASSIAVTLPQATTAGFTGNFYCFVKNLGAGTVTITPTTSTIDTGTALVLRTGQWGIIFSDNTNFQCLTTGSITGNPVVTSVGTRGIPLATQDGAYGLLIEDAGTTIRHSSATPHTYTIPANASVAFPVGTAITIINEPGGGAITLAITTDTLNRGDGVAGTGSRTISANSVATVIKTAATTWMITGSFT
jgi:hypothetical protein